MLWVLIVFISQRFHSIFNNNKRLRPVLKSHQMKRQNIGIIKHNNTAINTKHKKLSYPELSTK